MQPSADKQDTRLRRTSHSHLKRLAVKLVAAACVAACVAVGAALWLGGAFLPSWVAWNRVELAVDLDGDGGFEVIRLSDRQVQVWDGGELTCTTRGEWNVSDVLVGDIDRDGIPELVCITWKRGSYGPYRPFWVKRDEVGFSQHVFIFRYEAGVLSQVWLSSAMDMQISQARLDVADDLHLISPQGEETIWEWQSWGLALIDEDNPSTRAGFQEATLLAAGDNIAHESICHSCYRAETSSFDFSGLFAQVSGFIGGYDIAAVNQETIFTGDVDEVSGYPLFATPDAMGDALARAGFTVVEAATNHAADQGAAGICHTVAYWEEAHPEVTLLGLHGSRDDATQIRYIEANGIRFALFNYTYGLNGLSLPRGQEWLVDQLRDADALFAGLAAAEEESDASVCFLHVGEEYAAVPSKEVEELAARLIDAGADAVICTHPHVVQRAEWVRTEQGNRGVVYYSLGNLVANQQDPATVLGAVAALTFEKVTGADGVTQTRIASAQMVPTACHFDSGGTTVYLLENYTEALASQHLLNVRGEGSVTLANLQRQWAEML